MPGPKGHWFPKVLTPKVLGKLSPSSSSSSAWLGPTFHNPFQELPFQPLLAEHERTAPDNRQVHPQLAEGLCCWKGALGQEATVGATLPDLGSLGLVGGHNLPQSILGHHLGLSSISVPRCVAQDSHSFLKYPSLNFYL